MKAMWVLVHDYGPLCVFRGDTEKEARQMLRKGMSKADILEFEGHKSFKFIRIQTLEELDALCREEFGSGWDGSFHIKEEVTF